MRSAMQDETWWLRRYKDRRRTIDVNRVIGIQSLLACRFYLIDHRRHMLLHLPGHLAVQVSHVAHKGIMGRQYFFGFYFQKIEIYFRII